MKLEGINSGGALNKMVEVIIEKYYNYKKEDIKK